LISAVVLAAGRSRRMGQPKMALPWGDTSVIGRVVQVLEQAGLADILVVTGGAQEAVRAALQGSPARLVHNPGYAEGEMLSSLQVGLAALPETCDAALVALGDQPQIQPQVVAALLERYRATHADLVVPSFAMHRGHPWIVGRSLWPEIAALQPPHTLRHLLQAHAGSIDYLPVDTDSILADLDTPQDYRNNAPGLG
jgi:molybdenum cofactor cytidylyltransferase